MSKFTQIIEVKNEIYAVYKEEDNSECFSRVYFAALCEDEELNYMVLLTGADDGIFDDANEAENFIRYHYGPKPYGK